ncbi:putative protein OS=Tsukamurella paurometabola (strain ATCC 8368 / DSM / CCUG 35730 /CIP 100753 / JCM 10117 / KCTC 9821 / NBRC 16120 / NCIMB 702349/ NCTC 13040) OX=521096 GN=Tpau_4156 PE=4 SV=1 [Tsukamurella paurometabola]|uniref:Uncharacterized protein n=1 Tax=Tsukamurella paurometabola (strain ATCC 8368 / DSM 20162 / CCUG 35730 / CIP 100753 / JCM 10117 / KCTC 9821 / NBRC 16120 / NCIMB 702349 / NCTC 13040) TaxID=521096 RepID=D5UP16_TSUPD|nr:hypothetical protein [Tsukamurella paurometabola]ADG80725.1 hypothetical protein Tpau_4156 [Tsukamurella paurometabola DSM 20162]SUP40719.1 Uncharacterised protein [Tsukamurella paurometabola]
MITVLALIAFVVGLAWLTHDRNDLDFRARDQRGAAADRDRRTGSGGVIVP